MAGRDIFINFSQHGSDSTFINSIVPTTLNASAHLSREWIDKKHINILHTLLMGMI